jgi:hypothetical protein
VGSAGAVLALALLAAHPAASTWRATGLLTALGALGMTYALLMAQGRRFLAPRELGRGLTLLNCASFTGAAVLQSVSGIVVRLSEDSGPEAAYRMLFAFLAAVLVLALVTYARSADARRDGKPI